MTGFRIVEVFRPDREIVVKGVDDCSPNGCVPASAFFPDAGRHELLIYPKMFAQIHKEQVDTLIHEIGHRRLLAAVSGTGPIAANTARPRANPDPGTAAAR